MNKIFENLYKCEINWSIKTFWDNGYEVVLGDEMNGIIDQTNVDTMMNAAIWLDNKAKHHFEEYKSCIDMIDKEPDNE